LRDNKIVLLGYTAFPEVNQLTKLIAINYAGGASEI